jgi:hypothetical protein
MPAVEPDSREQAASAMTTAAIGGNRRNTCMAIIR